VFSNARGLSVFTKFEPLLTINEVTNLAYLANGFSFAKNGKGVSLTISL
jgi:hypothetical protein